jgi:hypothetical protein
MCNYNGDCGSDEILDMRNPVQCGGECGGDETLDLRNP